MNTTKKLLAFMALMAVVLVSCEKDEEPEPEVMPPSNVAATVVVSTDNSGDVTVTPTADGASRFDLYWGDATTAPTTVNPGSSATHTYEEGDYTLRVVAVGSTGLTTEITKQVNVTFAAPANLAVNAAISETNLFEVTVTPTADNASMFDVDFGVEGADVQSILAGESATYEYAEAGDYTITVTAKGAGAATSEATETVSITGPTGSISLPVDFEDATVAYEFTDFEGNFASVVDNPDTDGNESAKVGSILKTSGSAVFAGSIITLGSAIDFTQGNTIQMKAWSPKAGGTVKMKLEDSSDPPVGIEVDATTENASAWETLSFNFAAQINPEISYNKVIIFFDFGNPGDDTTYYFDDIELVEGASKERPQLPLGFENSDTEDYTWGVFGGVDPAEVIANPDTNGNTSANVTAITKNAGAEVWAGASLNLNGAIDWSAGTTVKMDVWSPRAGTPILLKLEDSSTNTGSGASTFAEVSASTTQAGMWETLYYDMTGANGGFATTTTYDAVVVFPDFGTNGGGETFYVDNIEVTADNGGGGGNDAPTTAADAPMVDEANVISIFSDSYSDVSMATWRTDWSNANYELIDIAGNAVHKYSALNFAGAEPASPIDATEMTKIHLDFWTADATQVRFKIVDFGADGGFDGGDDTEHEYAVESPTQGQWVSLDLDLATDFPGLTTKASVAQFIMAAQPAGGATVYFDNIYFYKEGGSTGGDAPTTAAPTPTENSADVISFFSDAYNDVTVDTWRTDWSSATFEDVMVDMNATKKYSDLDFVGIETVANQVDASSMTNLRMDIWTPNATLFGVKLVDFGEDGGFGGGDDVEHQVNIENPANNEWVSLDIPLTDFVGLTKTSNIAQMILVGQPTGTTTVFIDNIYFYDSGNGGGGGNDAPTTAAPDPTQAEADVISIFSDSYTDTTVDTYRTDWSSGTLETTDINGNNVLKYVGLSFAGIETVASQVDASEMTHVHLDVWTADATQFRVKIVDFGADGGFGGGDDTEHEIAYENPTQGSWISYDIPLSDFTGLANKSNLAQYILSAQPANQATIYVDNIYLYK